MNRNAFLTALYEENRELLYAVCRKEVNYRARYHELIEDCIQETFAIATRRWEQLVDHPNVRGWLVITCLNLIKDRQRQYKLRQRILSKLADRPGQANNYPSYAFEQNLDEDILRSNLERLTFSMNKDEKTIYTAYFIEQRTMKSIAEQLHMTENQVKNHIKRIRRSAKRLFGESRE